LWWMNTRPWQSAYQTWLPADLEFKCRLLGLLPA
jgi:hypothetical protein